MPNYRYDLRKAYREMLEEEAKQITENAPAGAMTAAGGTSTSVSGDSGGGTSDNQGSYGPSDSRVMTPLIIPMHKRKLQEMLAKESGCTKNVNEACGNCECDQCKGEKEGGDSKALLMDGCKKHLTEFFGESFVIEEYQDESMSQEDLDECYMVTITKKGDDNQQGQQQLQEPPVGQAHATKICQKCNTSPCKCQDQQGQADSNIQG
jgi:hypothetical protein